MSDHGFNFDKRNLSDLHQRFESLLMFYSYDNWHGDAMLFIFMGSLVRWAKSHIEPPLHAINFGDLALFVSSWKLQSRSVELCVTTSTVQERPMQPFFGTQNIKQINKTKQLYVVWEVLKCACKDL